MAKSKPLKKQSATLQDNKTQTAMWEKRERTLPLAEISTTRGQRYVKTSCQMPINKYDKIGK